jgi:hypothetical protein
MFQIILETTSGCTFNILHFDVLPLLIYLHTCVQIKSVSSQNFTLILFCHLSYFCHICNGKTPSEELDQESHVTSWEMFKLTVFDKLANCQAQLGLEEGIEYGVGR